MDANRFYFPHLSHPGMCEVSRIEHSKVLMRSGGLENRKPLNVTQHLLADDLIMSTTANQFHTDRDYLRLPTHMTYFDTQVFLW